MKNHLSKVEAFSDFSGKREDLILSAVSYLKTAGGVSAQLWKQVEKRAVERGLLTRGGYMDIREIILVFFLRFFEPFVTFNSLLTKELRNLKFFVYSTGIIFSDL